MLNQISNWSRRITREMRVITESNISHRNKAGSKLKLAMSSSEIVHPGLSNAVKAKLRSSSSKAKITVTVPVQNDKH
jgi:hypothetical protein